MHRYNAKLLLFGEYLIIRSGRALAIPYPKYGGSWQFKTDDPTAQQDLMGWVDYLSELADAGTLLCDLQIDKFHSDLQKGLYFDSHIPVGYGLGSSGALCAALYNQYGINQIQKNAVDRFGELRKILAQLENYFHGSSSGIDPLISYTENAVMIDEDGSMELVSLPESKSDAQFFLIDTGKPRQTGPLVQYFLKQCKDSQYAQKIDGSVMNASAQAMNQLIDNDHDGLAMSMATLSKLQYELFLKMIPEAFRDVWQKGISTEDFSLKLCGAGGGGFILGFTQKPDVLEEHLKGLDWQILNF